MKKLAFVFVVLGSGLAAFGLSGWRMATSIMSTLPGYGGNPDIYAGWTPNSQLEITVGVILLVCGLLLRREAR